MTQAIVSTAYTGNVLLALYGEEHALELPINLAPASTFVAGTVLGCITNLAQDVQTFTATGTPTGGSFAYTVTDPRTNAQSTLTLAFGETSTTLQAKLNTIFGSGVLTAGGGAWPGTPLTVTASSSGPLAGVPIPVAVAGTNSFTGGSTPASTVAHTTTGRSASTYGAYASGNSDGTQTPTCLLKYDCVTDAAGRVVLGTGMATGATTTLLTGPHGSNRPDAPAYFRGDFDVTKLTGLDATALTNGKWRLYSGAVAGPGVLRLT